MLASEKANREKKEEKARPVRLMDRCEGQTRAMEQTAVMDEREKEADMIGACKRGDRAAFHMLFEAYKDKVYSIALHYSNEEAMACDVTQQVFLKLFTSIGNFREDSEF